LKYRAVGYLHGIWWCTAIEAANILVTAEGEAKFWI